MSLEIGEVEKWCCRENSTQQRAWPPGLRLSNPGERERNADAHKSGGQYAAVLFDLQLPFNPFNIKWEVYISQRNVFARRYCVVMILHAYVDVYVLCVCIGGQDGGYTIQYNYEELCDDTGYNLEDLPGAMNDRDSWRERVREICAGSGR